MFKPRQSQIPILAYESGYMGISAVPGSGKTTTLSQLAARLILSGKLEEGQELLIVTLTNSAVDNFNAQLERILKKANMLPGMGYCVKTLHSLALDILRRRPELANLDAQFEIADVRIKGELIQDSVRKWMRLTPEVLGDWSADESPQSGKNTSRWEEYLSEVANAFIRQSKNYGYEPEDVAFLARQKGTDDPLLMFGINVYQDYQQGLRYRGAVDFDDLIRLAHRVLLTDPDYLADLQQRWVFILEDEAQDSNLQQEEILRLLSAKTNNWVRVGDPNQAIYETFTTASPEHLIRFIQTPGVRVHNLPETGRSSRSIINLANMLIDWVNKNHPIPAVRDALSKPYLQLTKPGDPNPNPPDSPKAVTFHLANLSPDQELDKVSNSLQRRLADHPDETIAVMCQTNNHAANLVTCLKEKNIPFVELLNTDDESRQQLQVFTKVLQHLQVPKSNSYLADLFDAWLSSSANAELKSINLTGLQSSLKTLDDKLNFFWPAPGANWKSTFKSDNFQPEDLEILDTFRQTLQKWHKASLLPIDQLILIIASDCFIHQTELSLSYVVAQYLERVANDNPLYDYDLFLDQLGKISKSSAQLNMASQANTEFSPDKHRGQVTVTTFHKAKGLEWDVVFAMSLNNYDFPSGDEADRYQSEKYFVQNQENLVARILALLEELAPQQSQNVRHLDPKINARYDLASERLRLLFVGITRAKKHLILTTNTGKNNKSKPALAILALQELWKSNHEHIA